MTLLTKWRPRAGTIPGRREHLKSRPAKSRRPTGATRWRRRLKLTKILIRDFWEIIFEAPPYLKEGPKMIQRSVSTLFLFCLEKIWNFHWYPLRTGTVARIPDASDDSAVARVGLLRHMQLPSDGIEQETRTGQGERASGRQMQHGSLSNRLVLSR